MTPIADMVERMLANNDPATAIVAAVRALESVTPVTLASRDASRSVTQEQARVRARNYRIRKKLQQVAKANDVAADTVIVTQNDVTRHVTESPRDYNLLSSSLLSEDPLKERKKGDGLRARGTRLQAGMPLAEQFRSAAIELGARPEQIPTAWAEFVDYWIGIPGSRGTKLDWLATWRNRVRQILQRSHKTTSARPLTQHQIERQESREILDDLQKFIDGSAGSNSDANSGLLRLDTSDGQESIHGGFRRNVVDLSPGRARQGG